jgi:hypothetical protein
MKGKSIFALLVAFLGFVGFPIGVYYDSMIGQAIAGVIAIAGFLFAIWYESYETRLSLTTEKNQIEEEKKEVIEEKSAINGIVESMDMFTDKITQSMQKQHDEICDKFMVYPMFNKIVPDHFRYLHDLALESNHYEGQQLTCLFENYIKFWFDNFITNDLSSCVNHLNSFHLVIEEGKIKLIQDFFLMAWGMAQRQGIIRATSIVGNEFWKNPSTDSYLKEQAEIIKSKEVNITRYFLFTNETVKKIDDYMEKAFQANLNIGIKIRFSLIADSERKLFKDCGLVDDFLSILNSVDERREITKSECYVINTVNKVKIKERQKYFETLEDNPDTIKADKASDFLEFKRQIEERLKNAKI